MNLIIFIYNRKNCSKSIVRGISLHNKLSIKNSMCENRSEVGYFLKEVGSITIKGVELPRDVLLSNIG